MLLKVKVFLSFGETLIYWRERTRYSRARGGTLWTWEREDSPTRISGSYLGPHVGGRASERNGWAVCTLRPNFRDHGSHCGQRFTSTPKSVKKLWSCWSLRGRALRPRWPAGHLQLHSAPEDPRFNFGGRTECRKRNKPAEHSNWSPFKLGVKCQWSLKEIKSVISFHGRVCSCYFMLVAHSLLHCILQQLAPLGLLFPLMPAVLI